MLGMATGESVAHLNCLIGRGGGGARADAARRGVVSARWTHGQPAARAEGYRSPAAAPAAPGSRSCNHEEARPCCSPRQVTACAQAHSARCPGMPAMLAVLPCGRRRALCAPPSAAQSGRAVDRPQSFPGRSSAMAVPTSPRRCAGTAGTGPGSAARSSRWARASLRQPGAHAFRRCGPDPRHRQ